MKRYLILIAAALTLVCGCNIFSDTDPDTGHAVNTGIKILNSDLIYSHSGGTGTITFEADGKVEAVSTQAWCKVDVLNERTASIEIGQSHSYESRYATLTFSCNGSSSKVTVHQFGIRVFEFNPEPILEFGKNGGVIVIPYRADCPLSVCSNKDWAIADWNEDGLSITVGEYTGERTATISWDIQGVSQGEITVNQDGAWKDLGNCSYTDGFMSAVFEIDDYTYPVQIQENVATVGQYRLINPYGAAYPANEKGDWDSSKTHFMYIDATDHDNVSIKPFNSGCDWGYGSFMMSCTASGTFKDDVITFPVNGLEITLPDVSDTPFPANVNGHFKIDLTALYQ